MRLEGPLSLLLPSRAQTQLLRSALLPIDRAAEAFADWQTDQAEPRAALVAKPLGGRLLAPLIHENLQTAPVNIDPDLLTYLRTASLREELRSREVTRLLVSALKSLRNGRIEALSLRGTVLPYAVYPRPFLRHTHDLDFLVRSEDFGRCVEIVRSEGYSDEPGADAIRQPTFRGARPAFRGVHPSGLPLQLHLTPFTVPHYGRALDDPWTRASSFELGGERGLVMDPADQLVHICVHASTGWHRHKLLWLADAYFTLRRSPDLDWELFMQRASVAGTAIPLNVTLSFLRRELDAPVPEEVLGGLERLALDADRLSREVALFGVWTGPGPKLPQLVLNSDAPRERAFLVRWRVMPTPDSLVAAGRVGSSAWWLPWLVGRPLRYLRNRIRQWLNPGTNSAVLSFRVLT